MAKNKIHYVMGFDSEAIVLSAPNKHEGECYSLEIMSLESGDLFSKHKDAWINIPKKLAKKLKKIMKPLSAKKLAKKERKKAKK